MHAAGVDVGLHLDLTDDPLKGAARELRTLILQSFLRTLDRAAVRAEICAQLDAFEAGVGHAPSFIDGHRHVHQLPVIRDALVEEVRARYGAHAPWIRRTSPRGLAATGVTAGLKAATIASLGASALTTAARRHGILQNGALLGVYDFTGGVPRYLALLHGWLRAARDGDLLMCHPGRTGADRDPLAAAREAEYRVLAGRAFGRAIRELGVVLRPMSRILADAA
jgi:predicted glycoside hydrolase/deacetylase ChbG (UPF0249 family)